MEIEGQYITVYVRLMTEGVDVVRPTQAERLADGTFRLFPTPDYDPEDETWEFPPASIVAAEVQQWSSGEILVAIQPELGAIDIVELGEAVSKFDRGRRAEFLLHLANELTIAARNTYGPRCDEVENPRDLRQHNEVLHRVLANLRDVILGSALGLGDHCGCWPSAITRTNGMSPRSRTHKQIAVISGCA